MVVALTIAPVLATLLLSRTSTQHRESPLARGLERAYAALLPGLLRRPVWSYATLGLVLMAGLIAVPFLGGRPVSPTLQERDLLISWEAAPGASRTEMNRITATVTDGTAGHPRSAQGRCSHRACPGIGPDCQHQLR